MACPRPGMDQLTLRAWVTHDVCYPIVPARSLLADRWASLYLRAPTQSSSRTNRPSNAALQCCPGRSDAPVPWLSLRSLARMRSRHAHRRSSTRPRDGSTNRGPWRTGCHRLHQQLIQSRSGYIWARCGCSRNNITWSISATAPSPTSTPTAGSVTKRSRPSSKIRPARRGIFRITPDGKAARVVANAGLDADIVGRMDQAPDGTLWVSAKSRPVAMAGAPNARESSRPRAGTAAARPQRRSLAHIARGVRAGGACVVPRRLDVGRGR